MVYQYKVPYARVSAQTAGEELARIEKENGSLTPELVVDESRREEAPLHPVFEWDERKPQSTIASCKPEASFATSRSKSRKRRAWSRRERL